MSQNKLVIRKNRNLVLLAIAKLQKGNSKQRISARAIGEELNIPVSTYQFRLESMVKDEELNYDGRGYILDVKAFEHISLKK